MASVGIKIEQHNWNTRRDIVDSRRAAPECDTETLLRERPLEPSMEKSLLPAGNVPDICRTAEKPRALPQLHWRLCRAIQTASRLARTRHSAISSHVFASLEDTPADRLLFKRLRSASAQTPCTVLHSVRFPFDATTGEICLDHGRMTGNDAPQAFELHGTVILSPDTCPSARLPDFSPHLQKRTGLLQKQGNI